MIRSHWLVLPGLFTSGRVERAHISLPWRFRCLDIPCPSIWRRARRDEVYPAAFRNSDVEILRVGTVGRRRPVRCAGCRWTGHRPAHRWIVTRYDDRPSLGGKAVRPVHFTDKRSAQQKLAVRAVKNIIIPVAIGLKQQFTRLPFERGVDE